MWENARGARCSEMAFGKAHWLKMHLDHHECPEIWSSLSFGMAITKLCLCRHKTAWDTSGSPNVPLRPASLLSDWPDKVVPGFQMSGMEYGAYSWSGLAIILAVFPLRLKMRWRGLFCHPELTMVNRGRMADPSPVLFPWLISDWTVPDIDVKPAMSFHSFAVRLSKKNQETSSVSFWVEIRFVTSHEAPFCRQLWRTAK